jgi:hypothetical protein
VRICADDQVAGRNVTRFHQNQVGDAGVDVVKFVDPVGAREIAAHLLIESIFLGLSGGDVVQHHRQTVRIVELGRADFLHHADRAPRRRVAHHQIRVSVHNLARPHGFFAGFRGQNFFGNRMSWHCIEFEALLLT